MRKMKQKVITANQIVFSKKVDFITFSILISAVLSSMKSFFGEQASVLR